MKNMKSVLILLALIAIGPALFAQSSGSSNIQSALQDMEDTSRSFLLISIVIESVIAAVFLGAAGIIYLKKLKGVEKKETLWLVAAAISGLIGVFFAIGALLGLLMYLATPVLIKEIY